MARYLITTTFVVESGESNLENELQKIVMDSYVEDGVLQPYVLVRQID